MPPRYLGRLELTWTNKDQTLLAHENGSYEWVDPADYRVAEVRLLQNVTAVGDVAAERKRASDNLLIRGDALHALQALNRLPEFQKAYAGKVRLVYIDPPFNTGQAFDQYDDNLEHSVWLTMFRDRLEQIKPLLAPDGSIWVHVDDAETHRARSVMDEVLGTENFVGAVIWQKLHARNNSAQHLSTDHDYLLVYAKNKPSWTRNRLERTDASDSDFWNPDDDPRGLWRRSDLTASHAYSLGKYEVTGPHGDVFRPRDNRWWSVSRETFEELESDGRIWWGVKGTSFPFRKRFKAELQGLVPTTIWLNEEVGNNRQAKTEITRLFGRDAIFSTPKPERLLHRIIQIATDPGDVVLDCFAGSGTTPAVAQKLGRRWVAVEWSAETVASFTLPRLTKVIEGDDPGGVTTLEVPVDEDLPEGVRPGSARAAAKVLNTFLDDGRFDDLEDVGAEQVKAIAAVLRAADKTAKRVVWEGGGGFRVLDVGPSLFEAVDGRVLLSDWAVNGALGEAVCAQLGYEYDPDPPFTGTKGRSRLAVVDGLVNEGVVRLLLDALPADEKLLVCGTAIDPAASLVLRELRRGSRLRKIPAALLDEYRAQRRERLQLANVLDWNEAAAKMDGTPEVEVTA